MEKVFKKLNKKFFEGIPIEEMGSNQVDEKELQDFLRQEFRVFQIEGLQAYSRWLEKAGYIDCDWYVEEPRAIDEFLKTQYGRKSI